MTADSCYHMAPHAPGVHLSVTGDVPTVFLSADCFEGQNNPCQGMSLTEIAEKPRKKSFVKNGRQLLEPTRTWPRIAFPKGNEESFAEDPRWRAETHTEQPEKPRTRENNNAGANP